MDKTNDPSLPDLKLKSEPVPDSIESSEPQSSGPMPVPSLEPAASELPETKVDGNVTTLPISTHKAQKSIALIAIAVVVLILTLGMGTGLYLMNQKQDLSQQAWQTEQSVEAVCLENGKVGIKSTFNNTEPSDSQSSMNVMVRDLGTNKTVDLGTVAPGQSKTDVIDLDTNTAAAGQVKFELSWSDGSSGIESRVVEYNEFSCQPIVQASCSLSAGQGEILINNTQEIFANQGENGSKLQLNVAIPAGSYQVTLASFDVHTTGQSQSQPNEQYYLSLKNASGLEIARSNSIGDLPDDQDYRSEVVNESLSLTEAISSVIVSHTQYPSDNPNDITPVCMLFKPVLISSPTPTPTPTTTPTSTPTIRPSSTPNMTPTPTPTPITSVTPSPTPFDDKCNDSCSSDSQCNQSNPNLICSNNLCRHKNNTGDTGCNNPVSYGCNSDCSSDSQCQSANNAYLCIQGNCRHKDTPNSTTCQSSIGGLQPTPTPTTSSTTLTKVTSPKPSASPKTVSQVDLPEAGVNQPTLTVILFGSLFVLLGLGVLLVP